MRSRRLLLATCALAAVVTAAPASASCPAGDGTVPGTSSSVTRVGTGDATPYTTIYVDDRDFADSDDDGNAGGLWIYLETNEVAGLQRGGERIESPFLPQPPYVEPIPVLPPNPGGLPILPRGFTLFPDGLGGCSLGCNEIGPPDDCRTDESGQLRWDVEPDTVLF